MSIAKPKPLVRKPTKEPQPADRPLRRSVTVKSSVGPSAKTVRNAGRRQAALPERVLNALGSFVTVSIADARTQMPKMVRSSAIGHTYLISNARMADAPSAVLIGVEELNRVVAESAGVRTLGEVLDTLPFSGMDLQPLAAKPLPGAGLPSAKLPE